MQEEYYTKFKCLLEYFVSHLEYKASGNNSNSKGYVIYIKPIKDFKHTGLGYEGQAIQKQIEKWNTYGDDIICINITPSFGRYTTAQCYLNWEETWLNVRPRWKNNHISNLYLSEEEHANAKAILEMSISELGLFDNNKPNDKLKEFFDKYYKMIIMYNISISVENYISLLTSNHNLILTGAPGTGKTYLAKLIAQLMIFGKVKEKMSNEDKKMFNEQCGFVQFHPSYDYTDFVEGMRPVQDDGGNVGFERKDGVFKEFCKRAVKNAIDSKKSLDDLKKDKTFEEKYYEIINKIGNGEISKFDLRKGIQMDIVEVSKGDNIILRTHESEKTYTVSLNRLAKLAKIYPDVESLNNISNIDKEIRKVIKGCHSSSYWAVLKAVYEQSSSEKVEVAPIKIEEKNFVFIIDEINRGEISKIFGELFFSIDPGYRGEKGKVKTQYQNLIEEDDEFYDGFYVPENVYIIGTMNDIDRSVESMDFAFRRRFAFKEIKAIDRVEMLDDSNNGIGSFAEEAKKRMNRLNVEIEKIEGLSAAYHIGPAYFLKLKNYAGDFQKLWNNHLDGLLREYLRGMQNVDEKMKKLKAAYDNVSDSNN